MSEGDFKSQYMQIPVASPEAQDPLIAKRVEFYQRFSPEAAERHWRRWLDQRADIDHEFARRHPYWQERLAGKGGLTAAPHKPTSPQPR